MKRGMTLIEALVWMVVFVAATVAVVNSILYFYKTNRYALEQGTAVAAAQRGMDRMVRTMREASYAANGAYPVISLGDNEFIFYADMDNDNRAERVRFYTSGSSLYQGIISPSGDPLEYTNPETVSELAKYIRNVAQGTTMFTYYDEDGLLIDNFDRIAAVRFVSLTVIADVNPNDEPGTLTLRSSTALRNLMRK